MRTKISAFIVSVGLAVSSTVLAADFKLSSTAFVGGKLAAAQMLGKSYGFGCDGGNMSPHLTWDGAPAGTKSFVLTIYDKDAPTGIGWMHWVVVNIPATAKELPDGASLTAAKLPQGALETRTDFGKPGYAGPCPPVGELHDYVFTLTALKVDKLDLDANATPALVGFYTKANSLGTATLSVKQGR